MYNNNLVEEAFSSLSAKYDELEENNHILKMMREIIYKHINKYLRKGDTVLELNSGTGIDAIYFAKKNHKIHCTDISIGMLKMLNEKVNQQKLNHLITNQLLSFTQLNKIENRFFDYIFSNFGGLNCTNNLEEVIYQFKSLLNKNGRLTLVVLPIICPWELLLIFKGNFKAAFRRLKKKGTNANIDGHKFKTYYYSVSKIKRMLNTDFKILDIQGLASISPPPYMLKYSNSFPNIYKMLIYIERKISRVFPFNSWADHFILTAELKRKIF